MKELKKEKGIAMSLSDSDTGKSLLATKVVDVTSICPKSTQCVIKYTKAKRGVIAQITDRYRRGNDLGVNVHYFINETTPEALAKDEVFLIRASIMGAKPLDLSKAIYANA